MRLFKRITALALAAVTAGALGLGAAAEAVEGAPETALPEVYCPVNDDPEFPFNIELDIAENSISYINLDEPVYGIKSILDGETLDFKMNVSLKDEFMDYESYTFELFTADYSDKLFSQSAGNSETITVPDMSTAKGYKLSAALKSESLTAYYGGQFTIQVELDSTVVVDLFYQLAGMEGDAAPYENNLQESEPGNNNESRPDDLYSDRTMKAETIKGDVDYFTYWCPNKLTGSGDDDEIDDSGMVNIEFTLNVPAWSKMRIEILDEDGNVIRSIKPESSSIYYLKINNAVMGMNYMVVVESTETLNNKPAVSYSLTATYDFVLAWYGQYNSKDAFGIYWNVDKLKDIKYYDSWDNNREYPIFSEGKRGKYDHVFTTGCGVVSSAMIFRNMGVTMNGYDVRTGYEGELQADPFTALLSNCNFNGTELKYSSVLPELSSEGYDSDEKPHYPEALYRSMIGRSFGLSYVPVSNITETSLRNAIAAHGYVLVYFDEYTQKKHFMVMTRLDNVSGDLCDKAYVLDPAAMTYSAGAGEKGNGILLSQTTSGHSHAKIENISWAGYFE